MEQNLPVIAKKVRNIVRTMLYMLKKGISKGKLMAELNMMFKRWKIAGKAIQNLMFHHIHHGSASSSSTAAAAAGNLSFPYPTNEYEFSCSNSPAYPNFHLPIHLNNKRKHNNHRAPFSPSPSAKGEEDYVTMNAVVRTLEMLTSSAATASPALPGFGKSPMVKQLRVTDSPFPLRNADEDNHIDEAADEFIKRFHNYLRRQNA